MSGVDDLSEDTGQVDDLIAIVIIVTILLIIIIILSDKKNYKKRNFTLLYSIAQGKGLYYKILWF